VTATAKAYRTPYVSQMLQEPDRTWDDCCASVTIMLGNDWTLGEWSIRDDGRPRDVHVLRNLIRARIGDTDGGLTLHDANDMLHELDPDLPDLPRYPGQKAKPGQSTAGATLRLNRAELKEMLMDGHSAAVCGLSGTVGHVIYASDGTKDGPIVKDPLTQHAEGWPGERWTWDRLWAFTEASIGNDRQYGSPGAIACAVVKVGDQTEAARMTAIGAKATAKVVAQRDAQKQQTTLATDERDQARRELATATARIAELEAATPIDCSSAVNAERSRFRAAVMDAVRDLL